MQLLSYAIGTTELRKNPRKSSSNFDLSSCSSHPSKMILLKGSIPSDCVRIETYTIKSISVNLILNSYLIYFSKYTSFQHHDLLGKKFIGIYY